MGGVLAQHLELLHYACEYGHMELIAFLIHQGVDIFVPDADGSAALSRPLSRPSLPSL
jgi:ankyrin repeat protein